MFEIKKLIMYNYQNQEYIYQFSKGVNYFIGKNDSGKTEFYNFIDYMFGSSIEIKNNKWYKNSLYKAVLIFSYRNITYRITRVIDNDMCYFAF